MSDETLAVKDVERVLQAGYNLRFQFGRFFVDDGWGRVVLGESTSLKEAVAQAVASVDKSRSAT